MSCMVRKVVSSCSGGRGNVTVSKTSIHRAVKGPDPGLLNLIPPAFEVRDHDPFGEPVGGDKKISNGPYEVGFVAGTKQRHRIAIYFGHMHELARECLTRSGLRSR